MNFRQVLTYFGQISEKNSGHFAETLQEGIYTFKTRIRLNQYLCIVLPQPQGFSSALTSKKLYPAVTYVKQRLNYSSFYKVWNKKRGLKLLQSVLLHRKYFGCLKMFDGFFFGYFFCLKSKFSEFFDSNVSSISLGTSSYF